MSYFTYPYIKIYKFYQSNQYIYLEKKFSFLWHADISNCFSNIYTHSISWAITDSKSYSKNNKNDSFFADFDQLMQKMNNNETFGILVGGEFSRIFAEIIFQKMDKELIIQIEKNMG